ncbi:MAG: hypothetical protein H0T62_11690 [Parachlamydiaceae bacterium]|nr:hypothetical protein [Parachlamydiaceae bacterium]
MTKQFNILVEIKPTAKDDFVGWQADFNMAIGRAPGLISLEFLLLAKQLNKWMIVQCFLNSESIAAWRLSSEYHSLIVKLKTFVLNQNLKEIEGDDSNGKGNVTEVFVTEVSPGMEKKYLAWSSKIHKVEAKFPGFRGTYVQFPAGKDKYWITLLKFDSIENLENWLQSPERSFVLQESLPLISSLVSHRVISPYSGWFASISGTGVQPPLWKQTMLILLVLFPLVMIEMKYLSPLTNGLNYALGMFIGNAISVALISYPMLPLAIYFLKWWLTTKNVATTILGTGVVILLYMVELTFFWNFM